MWALHKKIVLMPIFWKIWVKNMMTIFQDCFKASLKMSDIVGIVIVTETEALAKVQK